MQNLMDTQESNMKWKLGLCRGLQDLGLDLDWDPLIQGNYTICCSEQYVMVPMTMLTIGGGVLDGIPVEGPSPLNPEPSDLTLGKGSTASNCRRLSDLDPSFETCLPVASRQ